VLKKEGTENPEAVGIERKLGEVRKKTCDSFWGFREKERETVRGQKKGSERGGGGIFRGPDGGKEKDAKNGKDVKRMKRNIGGEIREHTSLSANG